MTGKSTDPGGDHDPAAEASTPTHTDEARSQESGTAGEPTTADGTTGDDPTAEASPAESSPAEATTSRDTAAEGVAGGTAGDPPTGGTPPTSAPGPAAPRRRRFPLIIAAVLAVAGIVVLAIALLGQQSAPEIPESAAAPPVPTTSAPRTSSGAVAPVGQVLPASDPTAISIPSIGVSSPVNKVGLNPDGTMEVPAPGPVYDQAAWYRFSPTPGEIGPAVVIGHIDSKANGPSVFFELARLKAGQNVTVKRADGISVTFRIDSVKSYSKNSFPLQSVYGDVSRAELRVITCGGSFDASKRSYRDNTVVFAHLVSSTRS